MQSVSFDNLQEIGGTIQFTDNSVMTETIFPMLTRMSTSLPTQHRGTHDFGVQYTTGSAADFVLATAALPVHISNLAAQEPGPVTRSLCGRVIFVHANARFP